MKCSNDYMIDQIVNDDNYIIKDGGVILTRITKTGKVSVQEGYWRPLSQRKKNHRALNGKITTYCSIKYQTKMLQVHRVVYRKFVGELNGDLEINHKDGNPLNNFVSNLELVTGGKNQEHSYRELGREANKGARKITDDQVRQIRSMSAEGKTYKFICSMFGLQKSTVSYIINRRTFADVF